MTALASAVNEAIPPSNREATLEYVTKAFNTYRREKARKNIRPSVSAQRKELKKIVSYCQKLNLTLGSLTAEVAIRLSPRVGDPLVDQHCASLNKLQDHAENAWKVLANADKRKPKDEAFHDLLVHLVIAWSRVYPKKHGVTRNAADGTEYHGPLLEFVDSLFKIENIKCVNLGHRLYYIDLPWRENKRTRL